MKTEEEIPPSRFALALVGGVPGALAGILICFRYFPDASTVYYVLAALFGAVALSVASILTTGRIVSLIFLPFRRGTPFERISEPSIGGATLAGIGLFLLVMALGKSVLECLEGWRFYVVVPIACACFGLVPLLRHLPSQLIVPLGCVLFVLGAYAMYALITV